jgi:hypothetical protein
VHAAIAVMNDAAFVHRTPVVKRLLDRIQDGAAPAGRDARQPTMRPANASITKAT